MPAALRILQSALTKLRYKRMEWFDRDYRYGLLWTRRGFAMDPRELEELQFTKLRGLIQHFRSIGLCTYDAFADNTKPTNRAELSALPLLTRSMLQDMWPLLQEIHKDKQTFPLATTGSTGIPVRVLRDYKLLRANEGCYIEQSRAIGYRIGMMHLVVWSNIDVIGLPSPHAGRFSKYLYPRLAFRLQGDNREYRRLYDAIMANRGCCVSGYSGMLSLFAALMQRDGLTVPPGQVACLCGGAEMLGAGQRAILEEVFHTRAHDMYGCRELHQVAWECAEGRYHINPRLIAEVVDPQSGAVLPEGEVGMLVFTDLFNEVTPLIRYRVGDWGGVRRVDDCPCGRRGWELVDLQGRDSDVIRLPGGVLSNPTVINPLMYLYPQVLEYQLVRRGELDFEFKYSGAVLSFEDSAEIARRLSSVFGGAKIGLAHVDAVPPAPSGKRCYYVDAREGGERD